MVKGVVAVAAIMAAGIACPAAAQGKDESGLYLGGSVGMSQYKDVCKHSSVPCDNTDDAFRVFAGYQFNRNWQVEIGGANLGEATGSGAAGSFRWESYAWDLSGLGHVYIAGGVSVFGRLGMYLARTTVDQAFPGGTQHDANTNSGLTFGLGAAFTLGHFGIRAEWQRYDNIGTNTLGTDESDVLSVGALIRF